MQRKRGPVWYAQYREPSGRQRQKMIGRVWTGRGRPADGYYTKRMAEDWLRMKMVEDAQRAAAGAVIGTRVTFADAAAEYIRYATEDRGCKPSTIRGYRSQLNAHLLPAFGSMQLEDITETEIERWRAGITSQRKGKEISNKTKNEQLVLMHAIMRRAVKVWRLPRNPVANVDPHAPER
jgi:integrase